MALTFHYAARSDVGLVRKDNQDSGYAGPHLLVVADGMGGHAGGDIASTTVVTELVEIDHDSLTAAEASTQLGRAITAANDEIAHTIASKSLIAAMAAKEAVHTAMETPLSQGLVAERRLFHGLFATEDQKEGMAAFIEKRDPEFKHR